MNLHKNWLVAGALALFASTGAEAASLGLVRSDPDVFITSTQVSYTAPICAKSSGGGSSTQGICGTTGGGGAVYNGALVTPGTLTLTDANNVAIAGPTGTDSGAMFHTDIGAGGTDDNVGFYGDFQIKAYFNAAGVFVSSITVGPTSYTSQLALYITGNGANPAGLPDPLATIITANLGAFGFSGSGNGGILELAAGGIYGGGVTGGYWPSLGHTYSGTIANTTITGGSTPTGEWTTSNLLLKNWSGTASTDTFVPVPAAVWLFGSGLMGLVAVARRRRPGSGKQEP